jgi:hypothetical protein
MTQKPTGGPAFAHGNPEQGGSEGMTLREYAAIKLRVPDSGTDWLDDMIREARRMDYAGQAMAGVVSDWECLNRAKKSLGVGGAELAAGMANAYADAMLAARGACE